MADIIDLILADHARMRGLFAALDDAARREEHPGTRCMLSQAWARLAGLLELHADAEEEICYPALFGHRQHAAAELRAAIADHDGIRDAVQEERLHDTGSEAWWRVVTAVLRTTSDHLASEEQGVLADFRRHAQPAVRDALGRQWAAFTTARNRDAAMPGAMPPHPARQQGPAGPDAAGVRTAGGMHETRAWAGSRTMLPAAGNRPPASAAASRGRSSLEGGMTETGPPYGELATAFAGIARALFADPTVRGTLQQIVDFAVVTVEGCDAAGIALLAGTDVTTPVYSDPVALQIGNVRCETGEGPGLDAITSEAIVYVEDLAADPRWPCFGPRVLTLGIRSVLSCRLSASGTLGALNLYARLPRTYGATERTKALIFAAHAGVALGAAGALEDANTALSGEIHRVENLRGALASREVIGQAEGILIERERITPDQAFAMLRRASQHLNIKLREVAQYVVDTGEVPRAEASRRAQALPA